LNLSYFISSRINKDHEGSFSASIGKIAVASIAVGLASTLIAFLILRGFQTTIVDKIYGFAGHMQVSRYTLKSTNFDEPPISLTSDFYSHWKEYDFVTHVQPVGYKMGILKTEEAVLGVVFKGVTKDFDSTRFAPSLVKGHFPHFPDSTYSQEVVLSQRIADKLDKGLGDEVIMYVVQNPPRFRRLTIAGIYETGLEDFDDRMILGDLGLIQRLNNWPDSLVGGYEVFLKDPSDMETAENDMYDVLDSDLYADTADNKYFQIFEWLQMLDRNVAIFLVLILFVASFNMISFLLILIMERTNMIGVLKGLGATDTTVRRIFSWNGMRLIIKGMVWGNVIAGVLGLLQSQFHLIPLDANNYYMHYVHIYWDWSAIILVNILTFIVVNLTLFIPTTVIINIRPIAAIKFD
jgi:lipoprotein-releasing system permease protein